MLMAEEPIGAALDRRIVGWNTRRGEADQRLPGAVDIVDAPAAVPAAVAFLSAAQKFHTALHSRMIARLVPQGQRLQGPAGKIGRAGIDHGVMIGEGDAAQKFRVVIAVESAPAAVAVLHGEEPGAGALA